MPHPLAEIAIRRLEMRQVRPAIGNLSPVHFLQDVLGVAHIYPKQIDIAEAVEQHRRVSVVGCNSSGKDWESGRLVLWWLWKWHALGQPAKAVVVGPTHRQVQEVVWRESRYAFSQAKKALPGTMFPRAAQWDVDDETFAMGFAVADQYSLAGFHSPHLLVIVTEAHAVDQGHIDAVKRLAPERLLLTGNPFSISGEFYDSHNGALDLYHTVAISAYDTPNIVEGKTVIPGLLTVEDVEERRVEWGEDHPLFQASILGKFPDSMENTLVSMSKAMEATRRNLEPGSPVVLGLDVAREGQDKTVAYLRQGDVARCIYRRQGQELMETVGWLHDYYRKHRLDAVVVDATGIGAGVVDRARELGIKVYAFQGGEKAYNTDRFVNRIAECWWRLREAYLADRIATGDDRALVAQVTTRRFTVQSDRRIKLESKDDMRRAGRRSPDEGDALAMTYAILGVPGELGVLGASRWGIGQDGHGASTVREAEAGIGVSGGSRWLK